MKWYQKAIKKLAEYTNTPLELPRLEEPQEDLTVINNNRSVNMVRVKVSVPAWVEGMDIVEDQMWLALKNEVMPKVIIREGTIQEDYGSNERTYIGEIWIVEGE